MTETHEYANRIVTSGNMFNDIIELQRKFGFEHGGMPHFLSERDHEFRSRFMQEELDEYRIAIEQGDLATAADSLVDLVVVALGTAVMHGFPWDLLWEDVHRANMSKVRGVTARGVENDLQKPPGWVAPQPARVLEAFARAIEPLPEAWRPLNPPVHVFYRERVARGEASMLECQNCHTVDLYPNDLTAPDCNSCGEPLS